VYRRTRISARLQNSRQQASILIVSYMNFHNLLAKVQY
jgi:hypothetical protein